MADIDFGQLSEALNDKADRNLQNVDTTAKADAVIYYQEPTSANNYTWYRKYASGWVEQGGISSVSSGEVGITLPITMSSSSYNVIAQGRSSSRLSDTNTANRNTAFNYSRIIYGQTSTGFKFYSTNEINQNGTYWQVSGMAAN